jgi:hypothetical protein
MLSVKIDEASGIAILEPEGALSKTDFQSAAAIIDPFIEKTGRLNGVIVHTASFPGWDSFAALLSHLTFVKDHHKKISRVALVTDSVIGNFAEAVVSHFINAKIKVFPFQELGKATLWITGDVVD